MKKLLFLLALILHLSISATAADGDTFTVDNLKYRVLSETDRTAELTGYETAPTGEIIIPSSVTTTIGEQYTVTSIGESAFSYCSGLTSVIIPASIKEIGVEVFYDCYGLTSVTIPNSVKKIGRFAFYNCSSLASVKIPESVSIIESYAFSGCSSLLSVTIPASITKINEELFSYCSSLTSVTIPNSVASIGNSAFRGCGRLTSLTIPNSTTEIGMGAFYECKSLTSVTIPKSVTMLGNGAFQQCTSLTEVSVAPENEYYCSVDGVVYTKDMQAIHTVPAGKKGAFEIPDMVTTITVGAFEGCDGLTAIMIPNSVMIIESYAFQLCRSLTSITIPNSVIEIGSWAFYNCTGLKTIYAQPTTPPRTYSSAFNGVPTDAVVYVPKGTMGAYSAADGWSYFTDFREMGALAISLSRSSLALTVDESDTLEASVEKDEDVTVESESWASSNPAVATVEDGIVTAIGEGSATITCTIVDGYGLTHTASCEVTVTATTGIANIEADSSAPAEYYSLSGLRVSPDALTPGLYIKRQGSTATKIIIK